LKEARSKIGDLEEENQTLRVQSEARAVELSTLADDNEHRSKELSSLRNRMTLSQQNWAKEREDLLQREALAKEEFEAAKQAMSDWEVLAIEERSIRENIVEKVSDLEEQAASHREVHERLSSERDSQSATIDGLQRALQEIQDGKTCHFRNQWISCLHLCKPGERNCGKSWKILRCRWKVCKSNYEMQRLKLPSPSLHLSQQNRS
jgi:hypothetical protein